MIAGTISDCATNPHPVDFAHEIHIWLMRILTGFLASLLSDKVFFWGGDGKNHDFDSKKIQNIVSELYLLIASW